MLQWFVDGTGDFLYKAVFTIAINRFDRFLHQAHDGVGVAIGYAEDQGLFQAKGIYLLGQDLAYGFIKGFVFHNPIDLADIEVDIVGQLCVIDGLGIQVVLGDFFTHFVVDTLLVVLGFDLNGWVVVYQEAIYHRFVIAIGVYGHTKYVGGVQCWGRG